MINHAATLAVHADWSIDPRKRWMTLAHRHTTGWRIEAPCPVGDLPGWTARLRHRAAGGAVALGVDLPLGLPRAYARTRPEAGFPAFLAGLTPDSGFFTVAATLEAVSPATPFYPARGAKGMTRAAHAARLGFNAASDLSRACDRATAQRPAGAPLFWTLGANQTGKAAITAWRDWLLPARAGANPPRLWPFEGRLHALLEPGAVVVAETYPAEALRQLGLRLSGSKRRQSDRAALAPALHACLATAAATATLALHSAIEDGFGADAAGEDRFDSLLGLLCLLGVLEGRQPDHVPEDPWIRQWEGWVLGQQEEASGSFFEKKEPKKLL
jgi:hypothetical protein